MKITKDESVVIAMIIEEVMYEFNHALEWHTREESINTIRMLEKLKNKIKSAGVDERRNGRTSRNTIHDIVRRLVTRYN